MYNYSFSPNNVVKFETKFSIEKNRSIKFEFLSIKDDDNIFKVKILHLDRNYNLINFKEIYIKTRLDDNTNNEFTIKNDKNINIQGKIFDAKILVKELSKEGEKDKFFRK